jgi:hypothetical protein
MTNENCGKESAVTVWTDHGLEAGERLRELLEFVRLLIRR